MIPTHARAIRRRIVIGWLPMLLLVVLGGSMAGCAGTPTAPGMTYVPPSTAAAPAGPTSAAGDGTGRLSGPTMGHAMPTAAEAEAAWNARPAYVSAADARTQEAYAFAIARPDVTDWMPCYCGCVAMDHRNNTDCYLKPRENGMPVDFDEHASYCGVCVDITLTAKAMSSNGRSLPEIRAAIDGQFGDIAAGTETPLPAD
jgi:hypothetical protein